MNQHLLILPILCHLAFAIGLLFLWRRTKFHHIISVAGSGISLLLAIALFYKVWHGGIITMQAGNWQAPFGITLVADTLSATMVLLSSIIGLAISVYSRVAIAKQRVQFGYYAILHFLLMGLQGAFLTGDIFNLYVWFEIMIISSFVLLTIGGEKLQVEGGVKYFTLNVLASIIFLTAIAVLYGLTGALNMADLSVKIAALDNRGLVQVSAFLFLAGFGIKAAMFPLFMWLPSSYHTPPVAVSALFAGLMTKVGVYAMLRIFTLIFDLDVFLSNLLLGLGILGIISGALGALKQDNIKQLFSWLIICHIGFMIVGLGLQSREALEGAIFYMVHDIIVKANLFLIAGVLFRINGTFMLSKSGGFLNRYPRLSFLMGLVLFSLAGIPPLSGFWPKLSLISAGWLQENLFAVAALLIGSLFTLVIVARLWVALFWKPGEIQTPHPKFYYFHMMTKRAQWALIAPVVFLAAISLYIGLGSGHVYALVQVIGHELSNKELYINAVLHSQSLK